MAHNVGWEQRIGAWLALTSDPAFPTLCPPFAGEWQLQWAQDLDEHRMMRLKKPRQTGGTRWVRAAAGGTLALGGDVLVGMPTLLQSGRVFMDELNSEIQRAAPQLGMKATKREGLSSRWNTGGKIIALSLSGEARVEGVTGGLLIVDESHDIEVTAFEKLYPAVSQAVRAGTFRVIFVSIGALHPTALSVQAVKRMGAFDRHTTPEEIIAADPSYAPVFDQFRATMTAAGYRRNIDCLDAEAGLHSIYPEIREWCEYPPAMLHKPPTYYFGIDVGYVSDETVVVVIEEKGGYCNLIAVLRISGEPSFNKQAAMIRKFIDKYPFRQRDIHCETNGVSASVYEALRDIGWRGVVGVHIDIGKKASLIAKTQKLIEKGTLAVMDQRWRDELTGLQLEYKGVTEDKTEWDHSDLHAALLMAVSAMGGEVGYDGMGASYATA